MRRLKKVVVFLIILTMGWVLVGKWSFTVRAADDIPAPNLQDLLDKFKTETGFNFAGNKLGDVISGAVNVVFLLVGVGVLAYIIYGGYALMVSGGDEKAVAEAKGKITYAIIGFIVIFLAYWIVQVLGVIFGTGGWGGIF